MVSHHSYEQKRKKEKIGWKIQSSLFWSGSSLLEWKQDRSSFFQPAIFLMEKLFWYEKTKEKFFENLIQHSKLIPLFNLCCFMTTYSRASTFFYIRRWRKSKKCPPCQNSISLNFWRFGNRHETDHTITRLYRIFFFLWKKRNFSFSQLLSFLAIPLQKWTLLFKPINWRVIPSTL